MKSTRADDVIIHALWPGPGETRALGVPLVTYASRSATRVARSGGGAAPSARARDGTTLHARAARAARARARGVVGATVDGTFDGRWRGFMRERLVLPALFPRRFVSISYTPAWPAGSRIDAAQMGGVRAVVTGPCGPWRSG